MIVDLLNRGVSVAGSAAREDLICPRLAPQRFEKIESRPGNGMASDASKLQHLVHGRAADRALRVEPPGQSGSATCFMEDRIVVAFFLPEKTSCDTVVNRPLPLQETSMADRVADPVRRKPPTSNPKPRRAPGGATWDCRRRVVKELTSGFPAARIARGGPPARRVRQIVVDMLHSREFDPHRGVSRRRESGPERSPAAVRRRAASSCAATGEFVARRRTDGKLSSLQSIEKSQNEKIRVVAWGLVSPRISFAINARPASALARNSGSARARAAPSGSSRNARARRGCPK